jgi:tight adherence protein B
MDWGMTIFLLVCFLGVVLLLEGGFLLWRDTSSADVRQLERRLRALQAGGHATEVSTLMKARAGEHDGALVRLLLRLPRLSGLERLLQQAGVTMTTSRFFTVAGLLALAVFLVALVLRQPLLLALLLGALSTTLPFIWLSWARGKRMRKLEAQLPDAVDLIARALRAGHSFPPALQMVSEELPEPIANEFGIAFDEINYGVSVSDAMMNLATRVPIDDLRFFAVAVILQRETGGNLAEILNNIATLIRERFKLMGTVRVLSAEGKMSAWVLTLLPFVTALMINLVSPGFMAVLWDDPAGYKLILLALFAMAVGIFWMSRIVKIRV